MSKVCPVFKIKRTVFAALYCAAVVVVACASSTVTVADNDLVLNSPTSAAAGAVLVDGVDLVQELDIIDQQVLRVLADRPRRAATDPSPRPPRPARAPNDASATTTANLFVLDDDLVVNSPTNGAVLIDGVYVLQELARLKQEVAALSSEKCSTETTHTHTTFTTATTTTATTTTTTTVSSTTVSSTTVTSTTGTTVTTTTATTITTTTTTTTTTQVPDGKSAEGAGKTCKSIVLQNKKSKNGFYYVTGPNNEFTAANGKGPQKVMCWMEDRDGGGWTLATKHWYPKAEAFAGSGRRQTNDVDVGVMDHRGKMYKMDDVHIRTYLGQPDPTNDATSAKASMMTFMHDQNGYDARGSSSNREYTIMKKYTARWFLETEKGQYMTVMAESSTTSELTSYAMPRHYDGSLTSAGEGEFNWRGNPVCGRNGGAGLNCGGVPRSGTPNQNPKSGQGCKQHLGNGGTYPPGFYWAMLVHNYDTYFHTCNGYQDSSGGYTSRMWIRSPDSQENW